METILRAARFEDHQEGSDLLRRLGLAMPHAPDQVTAHWRRLWCENPALENDQPPPELGWILESEGRIVGFFANLAARYRLGEQNISVAIASQWGIEKPFRGETLRLAEAYFAQRHADLILVTTAIKPTGRLFTAMGGEAAPQPGLDKVLFWILDAEGFLKASMRKKNLPDFGLARFAAPLLRAFIASRRPRFVGGEVAVEGGEAFDTRMDALWRVKMAEQPARLLAWRDARTLNWHFAPHATRGGLRIFTHMKGRDLVGYLVTAPEPAERIGLKRIKVLDVLVRDDDPYVVYALLEKAITVAMADGAHVLEAGYVTGRHRETFRKLNPFERAFPLWPCFWRAADAGLAQILRGPEAWHITPFDGDTALL